MKKLAILIAVILIVGLLAGCWVTPESKLISICVDPEEMFLANPGTAFDVLSTTGAIESVTANYEDGTSEDIELTDCEYLSSDPDIAMVNSEGLVIAKSIGETTILVTYTQHNFWTGRVTETDIVGVFVEELELNQAPKITSFPILNATYNKEYIYDVEADDPDGDVLIYSLTVSPEGIEDMTIESDTGVIKWKPNLSQLGNNEVIVEVSDGKETAIQSFVIFVTLR